MTRDDELFVSKWIRAKREAVFAAFTEPETLRKWFCPRDLRVISAEADVRVGGAFRIRMSKGNETHTVHGNYREVVPGQRLVFSHQWQELDAAMTRVTVEFADRDGGTLVSITQEGFQTRQSSQSHEAGWRSTLENLFEAMATGAAR
ncbi:MAG TPA: SRPBCC domain-containing protein [Polyangiaceae bacterium]|nr:SRPBCC domain-containing protein [Polyangiaceae bacterium]